MSNRSTFPLFEDHNESGAGAMTSPNGSPGEATAGISAALRELNQVEIGTISRIEAEKILRLLSRTRSVVDSLMCDVTRVVSDSDSRTDPAEFLRQGARLTTRESKRMTKVASQLSEMPRVREGFASGEITTDHVNALANAAERVGPRAVEADSSLMEAADRMLPDSFDRHARRWSRQKLIEAGIDPLEQHRRAREARLWVDRETGLGVLMAKLPRPQFEHLRQALEAHYRDRLRQDGTAGRDPDGVRTPKQRLADAVFELLTNRHATTAESITPQAGIKAKASTQLILVAPYGVVDGTNPRGQVEVIGVGPVPRHILATLTPDTELAGMIFDRRGRPLWLGRNQRLANAAQRLAVAVRDGGCFECGAPMHQCELHHIREWHRDGGPTDVDNLVAVCRRHHRWLEAENLAVVRTGAEHEARPRHGPSP